MFRTIKYFFQAFLIYIFFILAKIIGLNLSRILSTSIFKLFAPMFKSKLIIENNLSIFSKKIVGLNKKEIISDMWENYGITFIEYVFLDYYKKNSSHIKIIGQENLNKVIEKKKPVIFISGHFANFELMSMEITKKGIPLATIYRPLNNFFLNPFMEFLRKKFICKNQIKKGIKGVREAIEYIQKGFSIALMIDQRVSEGIKVNLFGKPALTTTLPAQLALKYNLSIVPVFIQRTRDNKFVLEFYQEINTNEFSEKIKLSQKLNQVLEKMISKNPGQWIWTHNRWK